MRRGNLRFVSFVGAAALLAALGSAMAAESDDDTTELALAAGDELLVERLLVLEQDVPEPLPSAVELATGDTDTRIVGSFTSSRSSFDAIEEPLRQLFVDADEVKSEAGVAVAAVARGLLLEHQAMMVLEASDGAADPRPIDSSDTRDEDGVALDADGLVGRQMTGLRLVLDAREAQLLGYEVLAELPAATDERGLFRARATTLRAYRADVGTKIEIAAGVAPEQMLLPVTRYDSPLGVAIAVGATYVCVDREAYLALNDATEAERLAGSVAEVPDPACEEAARRAGLDLATQIASDPTLDGVETAVTGG